MGIIRGRTDETRGWRLRRGVLAAAIVVAATGVVQVAPATAAGTYTGTVRDAVSKLTVAVEVRTGYDRTLFRHWVDVDRDCQTARAEVLIAETLAPVTFTTTSNCTVATGQWYSYYDARTFTTASEVSIDHMVALAEAWDSGASAWTAADRQAFANDLGDPRSLIAVSISSNSSKSDSDPVDWLPANEQCRYVADWVAVKVRWSLTVDQSEKDRLTQLAADCADTPLVVDVALGTAPPSAGDTTPPSQPAGLGAVPISSSSIALQWTASTDNVAVTGYRISRNGTLVASVTRPSWTDSGLTGGTTYSYSVIAVDGAGNASTAATASATTPSPLQIAGRARITGGKKYADLSWTGGGTRFDLWRGTTLLMGNTTVRSTTNQVSKTTTSATYTVCPAGTSRTSTQCSAITLTW